MKIHVLKDIKKQLGMFLIKFSKTKILTWYLNFATKACCYNKNVSTEKSVSIANFLK